jgi:hypothetical protein
MKKSVTIIFLLLTICLPAQMPALQVSANHRFLQTDQGDPFFWLGDTGWLLFVKCNREDAVKYLDNRQQKGFNVIQVMLVHDINLGVNVYGDSAFTGKDIAQPKTKTSDGTYNKRVYGFWDHVDYIIDEAAKRNIYMALVPVWGSNVKHINTEQAKSYAVFLANRFKDKKNIIWLNGGDIKGTDGKAVWETIGSTIKSIDKNHLMTFHPRGRNASSSWFHNENWLDFNMFQSGHRSYAQDTSSNETLHYGEDNWRYASNDYQLHPTKPTIDGEPSYEAIPYGLHKANEPYWQDFEIRRYAYWSVFAGCFGITYGHNAVMQFYTPGDSGISFFPKKSWQESLHAPGAAQLGYLKKLMLSRSYFDRVPDQSMVTGNGEKYNRVLCTRGNNYALFYVYNGRPFTVQLGKLAGNRLHAYWWHPTDAGIIEIGKFANKGKRKFQPPGQLKNGNDWVLVLDII